MCVFEHVFVSVGVCERWRECAWARGRECMWARVRVGTWARVRVASGDQRSSDLRYDEDRCERVNYLAIRTIFFTSLFPMWGGQR
ncbi:hypothetical protein EVAR_64598_1 [Eumeta japonica]|uniref:Uncharacterized protein n=1 Tax=Eumeta variegata TaxID=151549 RepID=A0A4C1Z4Y7_EUMVA|nr:hypothetical protein EVAR_64598_1 [Eumeta japonica]